MAQPTRRGPPGGHGLSRRRSSDTGATTENAVAPSGTNQQTAVDDDLADPGSLLGQLQRGRGRGVQRALDAPDAAPLVLGCVADDPRWDRQTEERADCYARLLMDLRVPVADLDVDGGDPEARWTLAFDVLDSMARRGSPDANVVLRTWYDVTDDAGHGPAAPQPGRGARRRAHALGMWTTDDLRRVARHATAPLRLWATRELGRRRDIVVLDLAEDDALRADGGHAWLAGATLDLGAAALPRARTWLEEPDPWLRSIGRAIVAGHGDRPDAAAVLTWFDGAVADGDWCRTEVYADALGRLGHRPALPALARAWEVTPHSRARGSYLGALVRLRPGDLSSYLAEAADDCEPATRERAAGAR